MQEVIEFAAKAHASQVRKGSGQPYIVHPMDVMALLGDWHVIDTDMWKSALCHDILEECPEVDREALKKLIGERAYGFVLELTFEPKYDIASIPKKAQKLTYLKQIAQEGSIEALIIKVADRCVNTLDFHAYEPGYAPKYWNMAIDVLEAVSARKAEIVEKYGNRTYLRIASVLMRISSDLGLVA